MPEYEVNLTSANGTTYRQFRLPAVDPHSALANARNLAGPGFDHLVSVHEVTLTPVILPSGFVPDAQGGTGGDSDPIVGGDPAPSTVPEHPNGTRLTEEAALTDPEWVE